jgi:uroporphyrinogen-III synthase
MVLVVTRPEPQGEATAAALRALGHRVLLAPMLRIEAIADATLGDGPWDAVLLTSANAGRAIAAHPRHREIAALPAYVVGERTGAAATAAGFAQVVSADGNATALAALVATKLPQQSRLLWLAGEDRGELDQILTAAGFVVDTAATYRAVAESRLSADVAGALAAGDVGGVLHFSARSAAAWSEAVVTYNRLTCLNYCLSQQVADALPGNAAGEVRVASEPTEAAMIELVGRP